MKKIFSALTAAVLLLILTVPAFADVIWEPQDDFYEKHASACTYVNRSYHVNSPEGWTAVCSQPGGKKLASAANGEKMSVSFSYDLNGTTWGVVEYDAGEDGGHWLSWEEEHESGTGWVDLSDLLVIYDEQSFEEEYGAEFRDYDGSFDTLLSSRDQRVIVWTYPASGEVNSSFDRLDPGYSDSMKVTSVWTDSDGRVWGKVDYYIGARGWVCLSDPGSEDLPVTGHNYDLYPAAQNVAGAGHDSAEAVPAQTGDTSNTGLLFGVMAVCGLTALMIFSMRKKNTD